MLYVCGAKQVSYIMANQSLINSKSPRAGSPVNVYCRKVILCFAARGLFYFKSSQNAKQRKEFPRNKFI